MEGVGIRGDKREIGEVNVGDGVLHPDTPDLLHFAAFHPVGSRSR